MENTLRDLAQEWKEEANRLRSLEANGQAAALEQAAKELEAAVERQESALLTIREAAEESGYSEEHLRRLARDGALPFERNGGSKSKIKIRRADLPMKQRGDGRESPQRVDYDPEEDARDIAKAIGGAV